MKEYIKIDASVASHKGNIHNKNEEKFYLNGQYMDLNQQKDSTSKTATHNYKQSVYGIASGTVRGPRGEQAAFIAIEALSRYHLYLEENRVTSFAVKKQRLIEYLESAKEKIKELTEEEDIEDLGATMVGLIIDENRAFGFSIGEEGFYMVEEDAVRRVPMENLKIHYYIGSNDPIEKILRVTDEFVLDQGDHMLLTSKDTYFHTMERNVLSLINSLSTKESTKAYIKELLTKEGQKNLTALLIYVEALGGYVSNNTGKAFPAGMVSSHGGEDQEEVTREGAESNEFLSKTEEDIMNQESKDIQEPKEDPKQKEDQGLKEGPERERIFEQRYAESRMLFNKKLRGLDFEFPPGAKSSEEEFKKDSDEPQKVVEEYYEEPLEDEENPWRTRSKFLLLALLAVGVIVMAFAFGTIRNLEQRSINSSAENANGEETEEVPDEDALEEESLEEPSDGEEGGEELGVIDEDEAINEDAEEPVTDTEEVVEGEPEEEETYEIQSGDTIFSISRTFYGDGSMVDEIIRLNNIEDINKIQVGDVLRLPPRD